MCSFVASLLGEPQKWWQATEGHYYDLTGVDIFAIYRRTVMHICT